MFVNQQGTPPTPESTNVPSPEQPTNAPSPAQLGNGTAPEQPPVPTQPPAQPPAPQTTYFTQADIERARKEEKDKLYGELSKLKETTRELKADRDARLKAEQEAREAAEAQRRAQEEEELSLRELLAKRDQEFKDWQAKVDAEREAERAIIAKEREFAQLQAYINSRVAEERQNETIAPELLDLVTGNTQEEVEQSISTLRAKTQAILENVASARANSAAQMRGVSTAGYAVSGPMDTDSGHKTISSDELKAMSMADWAALREKVLPSAAGGVNQGMFGR